MKTVSYLYHNIFWPKGQRFASQTPTRFAIEQGYKMVMARAKAMKGMNAHGHIQNFDPVKEDAKK